MYRAGFFETEITPPLGLCIPGYYETRRAGGVKSKLYAKAAVIECDGEYSALLCLDTLYIPQGLCGTVRERVSKNTLIKAENILIAATHTHTSVPVSVDNYCEDDTIVLSKVLELTAIKAADAIILAYKKIENVSISFGLGKAENIAFVREYYMNDGKICTNPGNRNDILKRYSEADDSLPILVFKNSDGKNLGAITSFALHHDTVGGNEYSSDYSGIVAKELKKEFGEDFVLVFFSGFCGNINHINFLKEETPLSTEKIAEKLTFKFINTEAKVIETSRLKSATEYVKIKKREVNEEFLSSVRNLRKNPPPAGEISIADPYSDQIKYAASPQILNWYEHDTRKELDVPVQVINIGDCYIYAMPGEIFSQFGEMIKESSPSDKIIFVSVANMDSVDVRGYFPIPQLYIPTVYESTLQAAKFDENSGIKMTEKIIELARKIAKC